METVTGYVTGINGNLANVSFEGAVHKNEVGYILVDGKRVDIPSYRVTPGQVISVREKSAKVPAILEAVEATVGRPAFVSFDADKLEGSLTRLPERDEINPEINEALVVEFYNKML